MKFVKATIKATMKLFKVVVWTAVLIVLIPIIAILALPLWLGPVVKPVVNKTVPDFTGTAFNLGKFHINPYTCYFELGEMFLENPEGFGEKTAVSLGNFVLDVDTATINKDVIVVENVELSDMFVSYVKNGEGKYNFEVIADNASAKEAKLEAEEAASGAKGEKPSFKIDWQKLRERLEGVKIPERQTAAAEGEGEPAPDATAPVQGEGTQEVKPLKFIVKRLVVRNISGKYGMIPFRVPSIEMHNLGEDSGGYIASEMGQAILNEAVASILASAKDLVGGVIKLGEGGLAAVTNFDTAAATEAIGALSGAAVDLTKNIGAGAKDAGQAIAGTATDVTKEIGGGVVDATKEAGGSVVDVSKNIGGGVVDVSKDIGGGVMNVTKEMGGSVVDISKDIGEGAKDALKGAGESVLGVAEDIGLGTKESLKDAGKELKKTGKELKYLFKKKKNKNNSQELQ